MSNTFVPSYPRTFRLTQRIRQRKGERGFTFTFMLSEEECDLLDALASDLGWSRAAVLRQALREMEGQVGGLKKQEPPGNRREVQVE